MPLECEVHLPVLTIRIIDERYSISTPFRLWKLSTFSSCFSSLPSPLVTVRFVRGNPIDPDTCQLLDSSLYNAFSRQIHRLDDSRLLFTYTNAAKNQLKLQYVYDQNNAEITLLEDRTETLGISAVEYIRVFLPGLLLRQETITLHGVLMEHEGRGIIITAPTETGKTTHAHLWRDLKQAFILNGDLSSCYQCIENGQPVWTGFGSPWCGTSGEYMNRQVPISAIVALQRGEHNEVEKLSGVEAFGAVISQLQLPAWDKNLSASGVDGLINMLKEIPVFRLRCLPDAEAVDTLYAALKEL